MAHILKNEILELEIELPEEGYSFTRFDWSGKITKVKFKGIDVSTTERTDDINENDFGKGLYNEFGIDSALGYAEATKGEWFHKIGIGLLKKDDDHYVFNKRYEIDPLDFKVSGDSKSITIECESELVNGYSYYLRKEIALIDDSFKVSYELRNTGEKPIVTDEYNHNFVAIKNENIGPDYILKFPFKLQSGSFNEYVNPKDKVEITTSKMSFKGEHDEQFFFSNLSGDKEVEASWELINLKSKIKISEIGNFNTNKINLWGWKHVVSPELFLKMNISPGDSKKWTRTYRIEELE
jgi:hypothetical protein